MPELITGPSIQQSPPYRYGFLVGLLSLFQQQLSRLNVLEVGAWIGGSTCTISGVLRHLRDETQLPCSMISIDFWQPYHVENEMGTHHWSMSRGATDGSAKESFFRNVSNFGAPELVQVIEGNSRDLLPQLNPKKFDFIYIDGSHQYLDVVSDIRNSKLLLSETAILAGDDLETLEITDFDSHERGIKSGIDYINGYHPGVTQAVLDLIGREKIWHSHGVWATLHHKSKFYKPNLFDVIDLDLAIKLIPHFIPLDDFIHVVETKSNSNLVLQNAGVFEIPHSLGPVTPEMLQHCNFRSQHGIRLVYSRAEWYERSVNLLLQNKI